MKHIINNYFKITHPTQGHFVGCELQDVRYVEADDKYVGHLPGEKFNRQFIREELDIEEESASDDLVDVTLKHWCDKDTGRNGWDVYHEGRRDSIKEPQLLNFILPRHEVTWFEKPQPYRIRKELLHGLIHKPTGGKIVAKNPQCFEPVKIHHTLRGAFA